MDRYENWIESVKERSRVKFTVNNSGRGAKEEAREGLFNRKKKSKDIDDDQNKCDVIIDDGFDSFKKKRILNDGKKRMTKEKFQEQILENKREALVALKGLGSCIERAFKTNDDCVGEMVNWVQDNIEDEDKQQELIDNIYVEEKKWAVVWRRISRRLEIYPKDRIMKKLSDFMDRFNR